MLSKQDKERLRGVHEDLHRLVDLMAWNCPMPFMVLEGVRTAEKQAEYVASGASQTMNSRHLTGHAVDLAPLVGEAPTWDWEYYNRFAVHMKGASAMCAIPVEWGGDWETFPDGPHWQLPWDQYPLPVEAPPEAEEPVVA